MLLKSHNYSPDDCLSKLYNYRHYCFYFKGSRKDALTRNKCREPPSDLPAIFNESMLAVFKHCRLELANQVQFLKDLENQFLDKYLVAKKTKPKKTKPKKKMAPTSKKTKPKKTKPTSKKPPCESIVLVRSQESNLSDDICKFLCQFGKSIPDLQTVQQAFHDAQADELNGCTPADRLSQRYKERAHAISILCDQQALDSYLADDSFPLK
jgi:hypothetical protein